MTTSLFGSSVRRREDPRLITGQGNYVDDIKLVGMLHLAFVRSQITRWSYVLTLLSSEDYY